MKKTILLFITLNLLTFKMVAQQALVAAKSVAETTIDTVKTAGQVLDADSLYHAKLIEQGKTNFVNKDSVAHFKGKRFDKAAVAISKKDFDALVESSIHVFKDKAFKDITDVEHRNIIRAINTISSQNLADGIYDDFVDMIISMNYPSQMTTFYKWTYSNGMGFEFVELGIDLDGNMGKESLFIIK